MRLKISHINFGHVHSYVFVDIKIIEDHKDLPLPSEFIHDINNYVIAQHSFIVDNKSEVVNDPLNLLELVEQVHGFVNVDLLIFLSCIFLTSLDEIGSPLGLKSLCLLETITLLLFVHLLETSFGDPLAEQKVLDVSLNFEFSSKVSNDCVRVH